MANSSVGVSAGLDITADRNYQTKRFHGNAAEDKGGARAGRREEYERGNAQEKTGRHDEQSRVFHSLSLSDTRRWSSRLPDQGLRADPQCLCFDD